MIKKLPLALLALALIVTSPNLVNAKNHSHGKHQQQQQEKSELKLNKGDAFITTKGLVCDFCARAVEKVFKQQKEVNNVDINLDSKIITVYFSQGHNIDDAGLEKLIKDSGYNVEEITRVN